MGKKSRDKGARGERQARDQVKALWNSPDCVRAAQVSGKYSADLLGGPPNLHIEVKLIKRIVAVDYLSQAGDDRKEHETPVVLMRENNGRWIAMMYMDDCESVLESLKGARDVATEKSGEALGGTEVHHAHGGTGGVRD